jgi:hypothetical protein
MTGDFTLTLPVMLDVEIGTSRGLSYGTIYTTKLLRRGTDIDRVPSADPFQGLTAADAMRASWRRSPRRTGRPACPACRPPVIRLWVHAFGRLLLVGTHGTRPRRPPVSLVRS